MKECNQTITVFNRRFDKASGLDVWTPTVISGVSWHEQTDTAVTESGLKSAKKCTVRIPADADTGGKHFVAASAYADSDPAQTFTLTAGDILVRGIHEAYTTSAGIRNLPDKVTILGLTDNRQKPRGRHFKVVCA